MRSLGGEWVLSVDPWWMRSVSLWKMLGKVLCFLPFRVSWEDNFPQRGGSCYILNVPSPSCVLPASRAIRNFSCLYTITFIFGYNSPNEIRNKSNFENCFHSNCFSIISLSFFHFCSLVYLDNPLPKYFTKPVMSNDQSH